MPPSPRDAHRTGRRAAPPLGRRGLLAVGIGAGLAVAGCSSSDDGGTGTARRAPAPQRSLTPDVTVATTALVQIRAAREAVEATVQRFPALRADLAGVRAMHRAHEASLDDAVPDRAGPARTATPYAVPARRKVALAGLAAVEQRLHTSLDGLALSAQSGDFARLLASMGAGIGQRLARWPS